MGVHAFLVDFYATSKTSSASTPIDIECAGTQFELKLKIHPSLLRLEYLVE